jgi:hypothetical protein
MSAFLTELVTECVDSNACDGRGIWKIVTPFQYRSDILGKTIKIESGFLTDYASVPRLPILYTFFGDTAHKSSVVHDWLYHHHEICDEQTANKVFFEAMKVEGVVSWRRFFMYLGVKLGGSSSWKEDANGKGRKIVNGRIV